MRDRPCLSCIPHGSKYDRHVCPTAAIMVGIIGLFNGFGRLIWATLSDYIGRPATFSAIFILDIVMLSAMLIFKLPLLFVIALCLLMSCYGAGFSVIPAYLGDVFGTKELGAVMDMY